MISHGNEEGKPRIKPDMALKLSCLIFSVWAFPKDGDLINRYKSPLHAKVSNSKAGFQKPT